MNLPSDQSEPVRVACHTMATRFEIVLHGANPVSLRAAGEEALYEIQRLEAQLNLYSETSELSGINARAARKPIKVEPGLFQLLQRARALYRETSGAFDITVAPLMRCWGFMRDTGRVPHPSDLEAARALVGMDQVALNERDFTIRFAQPGVMIDLGAIGKGYAIELAAEVLREDGVTSALLHGGTSTVYAIGAPPGESAWKVAIEFPEEPTPASNTDTRDPPSANERQPLAPWKASRDSSAKNILAVVPLCDEALSVSAVWGKAFQSEDKLLGHVIDPRTGQPASRAMLAAVVLPSATEADAFSTALLIGGKEAQSDLAKTRLSARSLVAGRSSPQAKPWISARGLDSNAPSPRANSS
jgi:thiamine biosynthesis lipoprotein